MVLDNIQALSQFDNRWAQIHSIRQIEVIKALAKHHHLGLAVKVLGVSHPALTRSLTPTPFGVTASGQRPNFMS